MKKMTIEEFYDTPLSRLNAPAHLGLSLVVINDDDSMSLTVNVTEGLMNLHGTVQAGMQYMICDTLLGMYLIHMGRPGVGMAGDINFYRPGKNGDTLTATIYPRKIGRRTGNFQAELKNQEGKMISECMFSVMFQ